jgi:rhodanese-related sulfurtransferase
MNKKFISVLMLLLFVIATPVAFADEEIGDVACAMKSKAPIPPGQFAMIAKHADDFFTGPGRTIFASTFNDGINDYANPYDDLSDFLVLDIRSATDYALGHIPGAVNVPFAVVAKPENLVLYPTDKPILVVCYTGQTASMTTAILNVLGYDAFALRFGMMSWNAATNMKVYSGSKPAQTIYGGGHQLER